MTTPHPGFERSSPDEEVQVTSAASDQTTRAHQTRQIPVTYHHRSNAITIPVSELPALHAPPSLPLTPATSQYAVDSATSAHRAQTGCVAPTFTLTAPHGITEAVLPCFEEDTPLLRSVTPEPEPESQLVCDGGPGVVAENDDQRPAEYEDERREASISADTSASDQEHLMSTPESLTIVGRDEHGDEYEVTFVGVPVYIFEHSAPGERSGGDDVVNLEHGGERNADTNVSDSAGDLDCMDDNGGSSEDSETDIDTLFSDISSTSSSSSEDSETGQDAGRLESDVDEADIGIRYGEEVPAMFTQFNIQSDDIGHIETQAETRQQLLNLDDEGEPTAIWYPWLGRTVINRDGFMLHDGEKYLMATGFSRDRHRLDCPCCRDRHITQENDAVPLLMCEDSASQCDQASDPDHPTNDNGNILHDHETADSSCPTIQWMHAFTDIVGVHRHLSRRVHQLRGEWPGHLNVGEGSSLVGRDWRDWREWRVRRRRAMSLLRGCVGAEKISQDDKSE